MALLVITACPTYYLSLLLDQPSSSNQQFLQLAQSVWGSALNKSLAYGTNDSLHHQQLLVSDRVAEYRAHRLPGSKHD
jgi:hypothetical protein